MFTLRLPHLLSAAALAVVVFFTPAAGAGDIRIGTLIDEFGVNADLGKDYLAGARTYFDYVNSKGGVRGNKIVMVVKNDGGKPEETIRLTRELIEKDRVDLLFGYIGDEGVKALSTDAFFKSAGTLLFAPLSGTDLGSGPSNIYFVRPSYRDEAKHVVQHFTLLGINNFVVVAAPNQFGTTLTNEVAEQLKARSQNLAGRFGLAVDLKNIDGVVKNVLNAKAQVVVVAADTIATAEFLKRFRASDRGTIVVAFSTVNHNTLLEIAKPDFAVSTLITQVVPHPSQTTTRLQIEHRTLMAKYRDEPPSHLTLEGFMAAKGLVKVLEAAGANPSHGSILAALSGDRRYELDGMTLAFTPKNERGSNFVDIAFLRKNGVLIQ